MYIGFRVYDTTNNDKIISDCKITRTDYPSQKEFISAAVEKFGEWSIKDSSAEQRSTDAKVLYAFLATESLRSLNLEVKDKPNRLFTVGKYGEDLSQFTIPQNTFPKVDVITNNVEFTERNAILFAPNTIKDMRDLMTKAAANCASFTTITDWSPIAGGNVRQFKVTPRSGTIKVEHKDT